MDDQVGLVQGIGQPVEQRRTVARRHLDHGVIVRRVIIKPDARGDIERFGARMAERAGGEFRHQFDPRQQRIANALGDPLHLHRFAKRLAVLILHQEVIEGIAAAGGVNARVDDIGPGQMDAAGHAIKQAGMVSCDHADAGCAARFVHGADDR